MATGDPGARDFASIAVVKDFMRRLQLMRVCFMAVVMVVMFMTVIVM
ncbi:MAG: hypothetical protein ABIN69_16385 [Aestuariivirga sp.]